MGHFSHEKEDTLETGVKKGKAMAIQIRDLAVKIGAENSIIGIMADSCNENTGTFLCPP